MYEYLEIYPLTDAIQLQEGVDTRGVAAACGHPHAGLEVQFIVDGGGSELHPDRHPSFLALVSLMNRAGDGQSISMVSISCEIECDAVDDGWESAGGMSFQR